MQAGANAASQEGCKEVGLNICSAKIAGQCSGRVVKLIAHGFQQRGIHPCGGERRQFGHGVLPQQRIPIRCALALQPRDGRCEVSCTQQGQCWMGGTRLSRRGSL